MKKNVLIALAVAGALPVLAVGVVANHLRGGMSWETRYRQRLEELEASGLLPTEAELAPSSTAAAEEVRAGLARLRASLGGLPDELDPGNVHSSLALDEAEWSAVQRRRASELLRPLDGFFVAVAELTESEAAQLALERDERVADRTTKLFDLRQWTSLVSARARLDALDGEHERAAGHIEQGLRLARLVDDGYMIGSLVRIAAQRSLWTDAARLVRAGVLDAHTTLRVLSPELARGFEPEQLERVMRIELAPLRGIAPVPPCLSEGPESFLDYPEEAHRLFAGLEARERAIGLVHASAQEFEAARDGLIADLADDDPLMASHSITFVTSMRQEHSLVTLFLVALAAHAHREEHGRWPESLDELAPYMDGAVPDDPWTGRPFRYARRGDVLELGPSTCAWSDDPDEQVRTHQLWVLR